MRSEGFELRLLTTVDELSTVSQLEEMVWGPPAVPVHQTLTAVKNGGSMVGAFDGETLVGFVYGFAGFKGGDVYLCSHMMGVHQNYRDKGIGEILKKEQARLAREAGYQKIRWTYDPLESRNAYLNMTKLGAICRDYIVNCYGEMNDELNKGLPSDRFNVEWFTDLTRVPLLVSGAAAAERIELDGALLLDWREGADGRPEPCPPTDQTQENLSHHASQIQNQLFSKEVEFPVFGEQFGKGVSHAAWPFGDNGKTIFYLPIPKDYQGLKLHNPQAALAWRMHTRAAFQDAFSRGLVAVGLIPLPDEPVSAYYLVPSSAIQAD